MIENSADLTGGRIMIHETESKENTRMEAIKTEHNDRKRVIDDLKTESAWFQTIPDNDKV